MKVIGETEFLAVNFLIFIRLSALMFMTPLFSIARVPVVVRGLLLLALSVAVSSAINTYSVTVPLNIAGFFGAAVGELFVGALMAFGLYTAFAAFSWGGRILDFQLGFGVAGLIDPSTEMQVPLLGTILSLMAVMTFFMLDGHHLLIKGVVYSLEVVPPGTGLSVHNLLPVVKQFGLMFIYGVMLVAPALFAVLLLDAGLAISARTMPQVNIFIVGLPLKIVVGLTVLTLSLKYFSPLIKTVFTSVFRFWEAVLN